MKRDDIMSNLIIGEQYLDDVIMKLLDELNFKKEDKGTICYKEVIKNAVCRLIEYANGVDEGMMHGALIGSMCLTTSEFYEEVYNKIITDKIISISSLDELHSLIISALPKSSESSEEIRNFNEKTYMLKAHALASKVFGEIKKQNGFSSISRSKQIEYNVMDIEIMNILKTYGFDVNSLGTFCYKEIIKELVNFINLYMDKFNDLESIVKEETIRIYSSFFYIKIWSRIASSQKIKRLEFSNDGFEFNFFYMMQIIRDALIKSDLLLKIKDGNFPRVFSDNIYEVANCIVKKIRSGENSFSELKSEEKPTDHPMMLVRKKPEEQS